MRPAAERIYRSIWGDSRLEDLREKGVKVHILDKEFGIDALLHFSSCQWISIQEKYREFRYHNDFRVDYRCPDFTQEFKNACGTEHESEGEWFKLGAQLYFYGWANESKTDFMDWYLIDILRYKAIVENCGGLDEIGSKRRNHTHGRASFYCIPINRLQKAIFVSKATLPKVLAAQRLFPFPSADTGGRVTAPDSSYRLGGEGDAPRGINNAVA